MFDYKVITLFSHPGSRELFCVLLFAHLLGDFVLQNDEMVKAKHRPGVLAGHAAIHAALTYILVGSWRLWPLAAAVWLVHGGIDAVKVRWGARVSPARAFWWDQALHLVSLIFFAAGWGGATLSGGWAASRSPVLLKLMILLGGFIVCVRVASIVIGHWVQPYLDQIMRPKNEAVRSGRERGLPNGGRTIGQWERALIFLFVFVGLPSGIGFLIAAKSVFRFGELSDRDNRMEAEYITIGTLMSFGVAIAGAYLTRLVARWP